MDESDEAWVRMYSATYILDDYIQMVWDLLDHKEEVERSEKTLSFTLEVEEFFRYANDAAEVLDHDPVLEESIKKLSTMVSHGAVGSVNSLIRQCNSDPEMGPDEDVEMLTTNQLIVVDEVVSTVLAPVILAAIRLGQDRPDDLKSEPEARSKEMLKHFEELLKKKHDE